MTREHLLTDTQMASFLRDGYLLLRPADLASALHDQLFDDAAALYDEARRVGGATTHLHILGDNLLARVPQLESVLASPAVQGALTSILGPRPLLHPHHFVHSAGRADQGFHQDGNLPWNTRGHFRSPRPVAAMLFYYPQTVTDEMGPTEVLPGTQYWSGSFEVGESWHADDSLDRAFNDEVSRADDLAFRDARLGDSLRVLPLHTVVRQRLTVPAGSVVIAHYDLVHRGTRQAPGWDGRRFMYKFYYLRAEEPHAPSWQCGSRQRPAATNRSAADEQVVQHVWQWLCGDAMPNTQCDVPFLVEQLSAGDAAERRAAGDALANAGAVAELAQLASSPRAAVRRMAVFAIGESRHATPAALGALMQGLVDVDELTRSNAAFALGSLARVSRLPADVIDALLKQLDAAIEPDNTNSAGMSRSTVRESVACALVMAACNNGMSDAHCAEFMQRGLSDTDRYVRGLVVAGFQRVSDALAPALTPAPTPEWIPALVGYLARRQYQQYH